MADLYARLNVLIRMNNIVISSRRNSVSGTLQMNNQDLSSLVTEVLIERVKSIKKCKIKGRYKVRRGGFGEFKSSLTALCSTTANHDISWGILES